MLSCFSHVRLFATLWTIAHQAPLSMEFSRHEYCNGLPCPSPGHLPHPGIEPASLISPTSAGGFLTTSSTGGALLLPGRLSKKWSLTRFRRRHILVHPMLAVLKIWDLQGCWVWMDEGGNYRQVITMCLV